MLNVYFVSGDSNVSSAFTFWRTTIVVVVVECVG